MGGASGTTKTSEPVTTLEVDPEFSGLIDAATFCRISFWVASSDIAIN
jgi:hypothetical protein